MYQSRRGMGAQIRTTMRIKFLSKLGKGTKWRERRKRQKGRRRSQESRNPSP